MQHQRAHTELNKLTLTHTHVHTMEFPGGPAPRTQRFHIFTLSRAVGEVDPASHAAWPRRKTHAHTHTHAHMSLLTLSLLSVSVSLENLDRLMDCLLHCSP